MQYDKAVLEPQPLVPPLSQFSDFVIATTVIVKSLKGLFYFIRCRYFSLFYNLTLDDLYMQLLTSSYEGSYITPSPSLVEHELQLFK